MPSTHFGKFFAPLPPSVYNMSSPDMPTLWGDMVPLDIPVDQIDPGMVCWDQSQLQQTPLETSPCDQAALCCTDWDTDHSPRSDSFPEDAILPAELSDTWLSNASFGHQLETGENSHLASTDYLTFHATSILPENHTSGEGMHADHSDIKLRSASTKPKTSRRRTAGPPKEVHARECHNLVEKQYRTRLKAQFEALLAVLPATKPMDHGGGNMGRYLSRGQVLDAARDRIVRLEKEVEKVASERDELFNDLACLHRILQGTGLER